MNNNKNKKTLNNYFGKKIETINDLYTFLDLLNRDEKTFIFRGQSNSNLDNDGFINKSDFKPWKLESSLRRDFKNRKEQNDDDILLMATNQLIMFINDRTNNDDPLNILAKMQHFNKSTILIDFTNDILHALFFAFENDKFSMNNEGYVSIFIKEVDAKNIKYKLDPNDINCKNRNVYICPKNITRGVSQKSYFILDNSIKLEEIYNIKEVKILYALKKNIIDFLIRQNIDNKNIFPDNDGLYDGFFLENTSMLFSKANSLFRKKRFYESTDILEEILKSDKDWFFIDLVNFNLAMGFSEIGKNQKSHKILSMLVEKKPENTSFKYSLGSSYFHLKNFEKSSELFQECIDLGLSNWKTHNALGISFLRLEEYEKANEQFEIALNKNKNKEIFYIYVNWGNSLLSMKKYDEAIEKYRTYLEWDNNSVFVHDSIKKCNTELSRNKK